MRRDAAAEMMPGRRWRRRVPTPKRRPQVAQRNYEYEVVAGSKCVPEVEERRRSATHEAVASLGEKFVGMFRNCHDGAAPGGFEPLAGDVVVWQGDLNYRPLGRAGVRFAAGRGAAAGAMWIYCRGRGPAADAT